MVFISKKLTGVNNKLKIYVQTTKKNRGTYFTQRKANGAGKNVHPNLKNSK